MLSYPRQEIFKSKDDFKEAVDVWHEFFEDDDEKLVMSAVKMHVSISKWPPSIAEIHENMVKIIAPDLLPVENAWELVLDRLYTYDMFADLSEMFPELVAKAVKSCGGLGVLKELSRGSCGGHKEDAAKKMFVGSYEPLYKQALEFSMQPEKLKLQISNANNLLSEDSSKMIELYKKSNIDAIIKLLRDSLEEE